MVGRAIGVATPSGQRDRMKRVLSRATFMAGLAVAVLGGCTPAPVEKTSTRAVAGSGWTRPPVIDAARRAPAGLVFSGAAEPGARVVLRSDSGAAYAAVANDTGRFEIRMVTPPGDTLFRTETQVGQDAAPSPDRLLILAGGRGPIAIIRSGGPTRRLDPAPGLGAIDSDGRLRLASGRTSTSDRPVQVVAGGETMPVTPGADGRWSLVMGPTPGADQVRVDGVPFDWPGDGASGEGLIVERAGRGWRVGWSGPAGARQSTWLPDAASS